MDESQRKKLKEFVISRVEVGERVYSGYYSEDRFCRHVSVSCPCGKDHLYGDREECDKEGNFLWWKPEKETYRLLGHIEHQIRMNADKFHIDLLISLIGEEEAIRLFEKWAKKNMLVALALKQYIEKLKEKEVLEKA